MSPRDVLASNSFDHARKVALELTDAIRRTGPFAPARLPAEEMGYTTLPVVASRLEDRWEPIREPQPVVAAGG